MKKKWILLLTGMTLVCGIVSAQVVTQDSINVLNNEKDRLKVAMSINENKLKLAKLENNIAQYNNKMENSIAESQKSADDNQAAANNLSDDSQDKKKAKAAKKSANKADSNAKDARKAQDKLGNLNKDIDELKKKITDDQHKLVALGGSLTGL